MERVQKRHKKKTVKTPRLGLRAVWLWSSSQRFPWLPLWPGANHFLLNLSFSICQHGKFGSHITWAFYGVWPSATLSVLYFSFFPQVKEQFVDLLRSRLSPKSILCLACWNFFDWLVYIESMPFTTSISVLEWPWNSMTPTLLNWRRARWHWHFCLGLVVELPFKTSSWVVIQRWLRTGAKSFHKDVITRSDFHYQRREPARSRNTEVSEWRVPSTAFERYPGEGSYTRNLTFFKTFLFFFLMIQYQCLPGVCVFYN